MAIKLSKTRAYEIIKELLDEDLHRMSRENIFAVYGYISAFFELGYLTDSDYDKLVKQLPLTVEEMDEILL